MYLPELTVVWTSRKFETLSPSTCLKWDMACLKMGLDVRRAKFVKILRGPWHHSGEHMLKIYYQGCRFPVYHKSLHKKRRTGGLGSKKRILESPQDRNLQEDGGIKVQSSKKFPGTLFISSYNRKKIIELLQQNCRPFPSKG